MKQKIIGIILIIGILLSFNCSMAITKSELNSKINKAEREKNNISQQVKSVDNELSKLNLRISDLNNEISKLESELRTLNQSINEKKNQVDIKQKNIDEKKELLKKRLVKMYKNGGVSYLDVLLGSRNYFEMLSSYTILEEIANADNELIDKINQEKKVIEQEKKELEEKKKQVNEKKKDKDTKNAQLKAQKIETNNRKSKLNDEQKKKQEEIERYNAAMNEINKALEINFQKYGKQGIKFDGRFVEPCRNKNVVSRAKLRWGRWHTGIDIGANYEPVYASASGIFIGPLYNPGGYGLYAMIIHGSGYATLYGHLSSISLPNGTRVSQGQKIAISGNSGRSSGPHLHFEIRRARSSADFFQKGNWLNPLDYLPGGYRILD